MHYTGERTEGIQCAQESEPQFESAPEPDAKLESEQVCTKVSSKSSPWYAYPSYPVWYEVP